MGDSLKQLDIAKKNRRNFNVFGLKDVLKKTLDIPKKHGLNLEAPGLNDVLKNPSLLGMTDEDFSGMSKEQRFELIAGEYFAVVSRKAGELSSQLLMHAMWGYTAPEWYDHRNHLLDPETQFNDFWAMSADNVISKMPMGARVLDLCSGDGFYDYHFYRHRASEITCIERDPTIHRHAVRLHSAENIRYINSDVLTHEFPADHFDTVLIRGAIEHFSEENQQAIFRNAYRVLKPGGWFCGDTPANTDKDHRLLASHEFEWEDEAQMRDVLTKVFPKTDTSVLVSKQRTTLFWQCLKA